MQATAAGLGISIVLHTILLVPLLALKHDPPRQPIKSVKITLVQRTGKAVAFGKPKAEPAPKALPPKSVPNMHPHETPRPRSMPSPAPAAAPVSTQAAAGVTTASSQPEVGHMGSKTAAASSSGEPPESYLGGLRARIDDQKEYPSVAKQRRQEGQVEVGFVLHKSGHITASKLISPSAFEALNNAALAAVNGVGKYEAIPDQYQRDEWPMVVTLVFSLSSH